MKVKRTLFEQERIWGNSGDGLARVAYMTYQCELCGKTEALISSKGYLYLADRGWYVRGMPKPWSAIQGRDKKAHFFCSDRCVKVAAWRIK